MRCSIFTDAERTFTDGKHIFTIGKHTFRVGKHKLYLYKSAFLLSCSRFFLPAGVKNIQGAIVFFLRDLCWAVCILWIAENRFSGHTGCSVCVGGIESNGGLFRLGSLAGVLKLALEHWR